MNILCTICSDLVNQSDSIYVTKCGHLFHHHCLSQWIMRSKSCPQCRNKVTEKCMFRIYLTFSSDTTLDDATTLQSRLDDAQLQIRQSTITLNNLQEKIKSTTERYQKTMEVLKSTEAKLVMKESAIAALKEQNKCLTKQNSAVHALEEENDKLKKSLTTLEGLQEVLNATEHEVGPLLYAYTDQRALAAYAASLKRALSESERRKVELRAEVRDAKTEAKRHAAKLWDAHSRHNDLEADKASLEQKIRELEKRTTTVAPPTDVKTDSIREGVPGPREGVPGPGGGANTPDVESLVRRTVTADSPYLSLRQSSAALAAIHKDGKPPLKSIENAPSKNALSIFHRQRSWEEPAAKRVASLVTYDGLGGHSRPDPVPLRPGPVSSLSIVVPPPPRRPRPGLRRPQSARNHTITSLLGKLTAEGASHS